MKKVLLLNVLLLFVLSSYAQTIKYLSPTPLITNQYVVNQDVTLKFEVTDMPIGGSIDRVWFYKGSNPTAFLAKILPTSIKSNGIYTTSIAKSDLEEGIIKLALIQGQWGVIPNSETVKFNFYKNKLTILSPSNNVTYYNGEMLDLKISSPDTITKTVIEAVKGANVTIVDTINNLLNQETAYQKLISVTADSSFKLRIRNLSGNFRDSININIIKIVPTIKVISNLATGVEFLENATTYKLPLFSSELSTKSYTFEYSTNGGSTYSLLKSNVSIKPGNDTIDLKALGLNAIGSQFKIKIVENVNGRILTTESNVFAIKISLPNLKINLTSNQVFSIVDNFFVLSVTSSESVKRSFNAQYSLDGGKSFKYFLKNNVPDVFEILNGTSTYNLQTLELTQKAIVRLVRVQNDSVYEIDRSIDFKVISPLKLSLNTNKTSFVQGTNIPYKIENISGADRWISNPTVKLLDQSKNVNNQFFAPNTVSKDSIVAKTAISKTALVLYANNTVWAISDTFEIKPLAISITNPTKGLVVNNKGLLGITVNNNANYPVENLPTRLFIRPIGGSSVQLTNTKLNIIADSNFKQEVSISNVVAGNYQLIYTDNDGILFYAVSDTFEVVDGKVNCSTNKDSYTEDEDINIQYTTQGVSSVKIYYSSNDGSTWNQIKQQFTSVTSFNWTASLRSQLNLSGKVIIRVADALSGNNNKVEFNDYHTINIIPKSPYTYKFESLSDSVFLAKSTIDYKITQTGGTFTEKPYYIALLDLSNNDTINIGSLQGAVSFFYQLPDKRMSKCQFIFMIESSRKVIARSAIFRIRKDYIKPLILWDPENTNFDVFLTETHLNAMADKDGSFKFISNIQGEVKIGDLLVNGNHTLRAIFTPTDRNIYDTVSTTYSTTVTSGKVTSVENLENKAGIVSLYPNPTNDVLNIKMLDASFDNEYVLEVVNNSGVTVYNSVINKNNTTLNNFKNSVKSGIYYVKIYDKNRILLEVQKLIVE